jgi:membrane fusion protein (multidrug efflux system)
MRSDPNYEKPLRAGESSAASEGSPAARSVPAYRRRWLQVTLGLVVVTGGVAALLYFEHAAHYESTDDAFLDGHVVPVAAQIAGRVSHVLVEDNQRVQAGDVLAEIDPSDFEIAKQRAEAGLAVARARLRSASAARASTRARLSQAHSNVLGAQADARLARSDLRRTRQLVQREAEAPKALDSAVAKQEATSASVDAARRELSVLAAAISEAEAAQQVAAADLQQAQAAVADAELALSRTKIVAQTRGRVTDRSVEAGGFLAVGQQLLSIVQEQVWVTANFKETDLAQLRVGQHVNISIDAYSQQWPGHVDSFQHGTGTRFSLLPVENATGNYVKVVQRIPVKIVFDTAPDPDRYLLAPGMSVVPTVDIAQPIERTPPAAPASTAVSER